MKKRILALSVCIAVVFVYLQSNASDYSFLNDTQRFARLNETMPEVSAAKVVVESTDGVYLAPFKSDGCSNFSESKFMLSGPIQTCCIEHDFRYWLGGSKRQRKDADEYMKQCIIRERILTTLPNVMYAAVRIFGGPNSNKEYKWGYGWKKLNAQTGEEDMADRGYSELPEASTMSSGFCEFIQSEYKRKESIIPVYYDPIPRPAPICQ